MDTVKVNYLINRTIYANIMSGNAFEGFIPLLFISGLQVFYYEGKDMAKYNSNNLRVIHDSSLDLRNLDYSLIKFEFEILSL